MKHILTETEKEKRRNLKKYEKVEKEKKTNLKIEMLSFMEASKGESDRERN